MLEECNEIQIIKINKDMQDRFTQFCVSIGLEDQILDSNSDKPLVVHRRTCQATYVSEGNGQYVANGKLYEVQPGDFIIMRENTEHSFRTFQRMKLYHAHWPKENIEIDREILEDICKLFV